jgi:phosphate-selective porin OprO/OprP
MSNNLIQLFVRFMMRFGIFIIVTTPLDILQAQNSANVQDQTVQEQLEAMRKEIADLKRNANRASPNTASPNTEQQGTGQNIGGTTTQESLLGGERRSMKTPPDDRQGAAIQEERVDLDHEARLSVVERKEELIEEDLAKKAATTPNLSFNEKGFVVKSADGEHALRLGGLLQLDCREYLGSDNDANNVLLVRRARVYASGTIWKYIDFRFQPEFGLVDAQNVRNTAFIADATLNFNVQKEFQVTVGKMKPPGGLEMLQAAQNIMFIERGPLQQLQPNRQLGFMPNGLLFDDTLNYAVGVFASAPNNYSQTTDIGNGYGVVARLFARPFINDADELTGLGFGVSGAYSNLDDYQPNNSNGITNGLNTYASDPGVVFFSWNSNAQRNGAMYRIIPQAYYYVGPWGVQTEYIVQSQGLSLGIGNATQQRQIRDTSWGWQAMVTYNITGEDNTFDNPIPAHNFDFFQSEDDDAVGLWQIGFRADQIQLDSDLFRSPTPGGSNTFVGTGNASQNARGFHSYTLGLSWWLNPNVRLQLNGTYTAWDYSSNFGPSSTGGSASGSGQNVPGPGNNISNNEVAFAARAGFFF